MDEPVGPAERPPGAQQSPQAPEAPSRGGPSSAGPEGRPQSGRGAWAGGWAFGAIVIVIGIVFLAKNLGWSGSEWGFHNWWALFILIPMFGSFAGAWRAYRANGGRFAGDPARGLMVGLLLLAVTVIFLLELDWGKVWPVLVVIVGIGLLLGWRRT